MSIEMATAFDSDYAVINEDGTKNYVETESEVIDMPEVVEVQEEKTEDSVNGTVEPTDAQTALFGN